MNAEISKTMKAKLLRFGVQIPELFTHRKFVSARPACFDAREKLLTEMNCSQQYLSIDPKKTPTNFKKIVNMNVDISETIKDRELGSQI